MQLPLDDRNANLDKNILWFGMRCDSGMNRSNRKLEKKWFHLAVWLLCGLTTVSACSRSGIERAVVTGTVTYDGRPVEDGMIRFFPIEGTPGPMWGAVINNGEYSCHGKGGVPVGTLAVEIEAYRPAGTSTARVDDPVGDLGDAVGNRQFLPAKYNTHTTLRVEIESGTGKTELNFDLEE